MSAWRQAGLSYINYSNIAAKVLRRSLKPEFRADALKRDESHVRITPWANGRPARKYISGFLLT
ncbi:ATP synthase subunit epsilon, mitochondrial [Papilio xuthus]|uniref:ATP synthase subunit epsilon, mitochondrial n=1 Tax=Papilio xuthus TaxID=66420 RepID=A0A194PWV5_PAPXU|nr:ATP synthase subunit epsilon, mitochondrial [Papilio xuthus]